MNRQDFAETVASKLHLRGGYNKDRALGLANEAWEMLHMDQQDESFRLQMQEAIIRDFPGAREFKHINCVYEIRDNVTKAPESDSKQSSVQCTLCGDTGLIVAPHSVKSNERHKIHLYSHCLNCSVHLCANQDTARDWARWYSDFVQANRIGDESAQDCITRNLPRIVKHIGAGMPDDAEIFGSVLGFGAQTMGDLR